MLNGGIFFCNNSSFVTFREKILTKMKKILFCIGALLLLLNITKTTVGQAIIMGSQPLVNNIDDNMRYFYDPGGIPSQMGDNQDPDGYYDKNLRDTMTLKTNMGGNVLYVLFEVFEMDEGDTLWIFDGQNCSAPLLGTYNMVGSPGEVFASGQALTFVFHSDNVEIPGLMTGWEARVSAYDTNSQSVNFLDGYQFNFTCQAKFYDSGGPNGNIASNNENTNESYYVQFSSPVGTYVKCVFDSFDVKGVMKVYDGAMADPNKRLIGQFMSESSGATIGEIPPTLFASGNNGTTSKTLTFVYVGKAGDTGKRGWNATISCVPELFESPDGSACPSVDNIPGGLYADSPDPKVINYDCSKPIVLLEANVIATGRYTHDYTVKSIPFESHIFEFTEGTSIDASTDDHWQNGVDLPFTFIFFGEPYTRVWPGTNGIIAMESHTGSCAYKYGVPPTSPPYNTNISDNQEMGGGDLRVPYNYRNCIYGVYEDIDCHYYNSYCYNTPGAVRVKVLGSYPCRAFVFNYLNVGLFGNHGPTSNYNTYQMVIYEGTSIVDVYVKHRACCASTNGRGEGIIGLQNKRSSQILIAPGYGMTGWEADEIAWRFTPITPLDESGELTWYENSVSPANIIKQGPADKIKKITVSPSETTMYISEYKYENAIGDQFTIRDTTTVVVKIPDVDAISSTGNNPICPNDPANLSFNYDQTMGISPARYQWSSGDTTATCTVNPSETTMYYLTVTYDNGCRKGDSVKVIITDLEFPTITTDHDSICQGKSTTLTVSHPTSNDFRWSNGQTTASITVSPQVTTKYTVSATMPGNCIVTDSLTVTVLPLPNPSFIPSPTEIYVENGIGTVTCTNTSDGDYHLKWNFGDMYSNMNVMEDIENPTHDYTRSGYYTITLTATDSLGCVDSVKNRVSVEVPYFFYIPNAFSPDGDGLNEYFAPQGQGVDPDDYSMQIFDRSGTLIFSTRNPYDYWDGRNKYGQMCPEGVYIYIIRLRNLNTDDKEYTGSVTLIR